MSDEASEHLILPPKSELLGYAEAAFDAFSRCLAKLTAEDLGQVKAAPVFHGDTSTVAEILAGPHDSRHLGMIEAIRGFLGLDGTATN